MNIKERYFSINQNIIFEYAKKREFEAFVDHWNHKFETFEKDIDKFEEDLERKLKKEFDEHIKTLNEAIPSRILSGKKLRDLEKKEEILVNNLQ